MKNFKRAISTILTATVVMTGLCAPFTASAQDSSTEDTVTTPQYTYALADLGLADGDSLPQAQTAGTIGRLSGSEQSAIYHESAEDGSYVSMIHEDKSSDCSPAFSFVLPKVLPDQLMTVSYQLRAKAELVNDKYITVGFDGLKSKPYGFDMFTMRALLNNQMQIGDIDPNAGSFAFKETPYTAEGKMQQDVWYSFQIIFNMTTGGYEVYAGEGDEMVLIGKKYKCTKPLGDIERFVIGYGNWGANPAFTYDIKAFNVAFSTPDTEEPEEPDADATAPKPDSGQGPAWKPAQGEGALNWELNDQIGSLSAGDALPAYDVSTKETASAYLGKADGSAITVKGEGDQRYIEINYKNAQDRDCNLVFDFPKTYTSGIVTVDYKLYLLPDSGAHWMESGLGTDVMASTQDERFAGKLIHNSDGYADVGSGGWQGMKPFLKGDWYRYTMTIDVSLQKMSLRVYSPKSDTPATFTWDINKKATKSINQFVVKSYAPEGAAGVLCVKDVAISYLPPEKKPTPLAPAQDAYMLTTKPVFSWSNAGADSYQLEISKTADFSRDVLVEDNLTDTSFALQQPLSNNTAYYWRVTATHDTQKTTSKVFQLSTEVADTADNVYYAGDYGLIAGDWNEWGDTTVANVPERNASIIQGLLDKAGRNGGGAVVLPEGEYCLTGNNSKVGTYCLYINYDNLTLTGAGKDENGRYKTVLNTNYVWDGPNGVFRSGGITIVGTEFNNPERKARENITISHFEMNGGYGWTGESDWGYDPTVDYGWDINHKGITVAHDRQVTHVTLDDLYIHSYSGETLYVGGKLVGYLDVKNCKLADTNASCFNLYAAYLTVENNQFGTPDDKCRFWIEYCPRASNILFDMPSIPAGIEKDTAVFKNNKFFNAVDAHGIAIAQGDCTKYSMLFENNEIDNSLDTKHNGIFQFAGAVYGPTIMRNNTIKNTSGPVIIFSYGGGTVDEAGVPNVDWMLNKNITFEGNTCTNIGGTIIDLMGSWGIWDPTLNENAGGIAPALQPVEDLFIRNNRFSGATADTKSVAIGNFHGTVESAIDLKNVEITGNTFTNCTAPEEVREFVGNVPLFADNSYSGVKLSDLGGIAAISPASAEVKPVYETAVLQATEPVTAEIRTGRNENGQTITLVGGAGFAEVSFVTTAQSYNIPADYVVSTNDRIVFAYDTATARWNFVSFAKAPATPDTTTVSNSNNYDSTPKTVEVSAEDGSKELIVENPSIAKVAGQADKLALQVDIDEKYTAQATEKNPVKISVTVPTYEVEQAIREAVSGAVEVDVVLPDAVTNNKNVSMKKILLEKSIFAQARTSNKNLLLNVKSKSGAVIAVWAFAVGDLTNTAIDTNLAVEIVSGDLPLGNLPFGNLPMGMLPMGSDAKIVAFEHSGKFPGKATIDLSVTGYQEGDNLYFYYYNKNAGKLEFVAKDIKVTNGKAKIQIDGCSSYVFSKKPIEGDEVSRTTVPKTGVEERAPYELLMLGAALLLLAVRSVRYRNRESCKLQS